MANDEYQIPTSSVEHEVRAQVEAIITNPETEPTPSIHARIKNTEQRIFSQRERALHTEKRPATGWLRGMVFAPRQQTIQDLIEKESVLGGALFGSGQRFWLDNKVPDTVFQNEIADWYHLQVDPADPRRHTVLRFQTSPHSIHKLYEGREYPMSAQEVDTFIQAVEAYQDAVAPLYPAEARADYDMAA